MRVVVPIRWKRAAGVRRCAFATKHARSKGWPSIKANAFIVGFATQDPGHSPVFRSCSCRDKKGWTHQECLLEVAVRWKWPWFWRNCSICHNFSTKVVKKQRAQEQLRRSGSDLQAKLHSLLDMGHAHLAAKAKAPRAVEILKECLEAFASSSKEKTSGMMTSF